MEESLRNGDNARESKWTEGIAVGSKAFVERTKERLGISAKGRKVLEAKGGYQLREALASYSHGFAPEIGPLRLQNTYTWN